MLDRLAEIVREQGTKVKHEDSVPCSICNNFRTQNCSEGCPQTKGPSGSLMLARWAVLIVAQALPSWEKFKRAELEHDYNAWLTFREQVSGELETLIAEATADGCKSQKQAGEGAE